MCVSMRRCSSFTKKCEYVSEVATTCKSRVKGDARYDDCICNGDAPVRVDGFGGESCE